MAAMELCAKFKSHIVNAARLVSDITGILVNELCDKSSLSHEKERKKKLE